MNPVRVFKKILWGYYQVIKNSNGMKTRIFFIVVGAIILLGIGGALISNKKSSAPDARIAFAQCIKESGTKFFGAFWCPHCQAQKKLFGNQATKELPYIECSTADGKSQLQACKDAGIQSYPTWEFPDGTRETGEKDFAKLTEKTGCVAPGESAQVEESSATNVNQ